MISRGINNKDYFSVNHQINHERGLKNEDDGDPVQKLGLNLNCYSMLIQFVVLSFGVFFFSLLYGISLEKIFSYPGIWHSAKLSTLSLKSRNLYYI